MNLLDNWYFADTINQRQQTTYTNHRGYCIDRWYAESYTVSITSTGLNIKPTTGAGAFLQKTDYSTFKLMDGTYTTSLLTTTGFSTVTYSIKNNVVTRTAESQESDILLSLDYFNENECHLMRITVSSGKSKTLIAAKTEIGSRQTLCRKEGSTWVLNDPPPNKALELAKCQRYFVVFDVYDAFPLFGTSSEYSDFIVTLPSALRTNPTIVNSSNLQLTDPIVAWYNKYSNQLRLRSYDKNYSSPTANCDGLVGFSADL